MNGKSFVDAYEQLIRDHNQRIMTTGTDSGSNILGLADDLELKELKTKEDLDDDEDVDLDLDEDDELDDVEDLQEDIEDDLELSFDLGLSEDLLNEYPLSEAIPNEEQNIEMNFSEALAKEFVLTVNGFTKLCALIVQKRSVPKNTADKLDKYTRKIKNIIQAAEDSV